VTPDFFPTESEEDAQMRKSIREAQQQLMPFLKVEDHEAAGAFSLAVMAALPLKNNDMPAHAPVVTATVMTTDFAGFKAGLGSNAWRDLMKLTPHINVITDYCYKVLNI